MKIGNIAVEQEWEAFALTVTYTVFVAVEPPTAVVVASTLAGVARYPFEVQ
jgi:hypothetical protein